MKSGKLEGHVTVTIKPHIYRPLEIGSEYLWISAIKYNFNVTFGMQYKTQ